MRLVVEIRCDTEVVGLCVLESSPGWLHCLPLASNCLGNIARGCSSNNCSCVDGHGGFHLVIDAVKISLVCVPGGGVSGTCRVYMAEKGGIKRNVIDDLA